MATTNSGLTTRTLGRTGLKPTLLGCGCAWTSDPSVFTRAVDLGINYFDTAPVYQGGNNEAMVRAGLGPHRKQVIVSTKTEASGTADALAQLERSLRELGTDYVDIWFLHSKDSREAIRAALVEAQAAAKEQGKARFIGVSTHRLVQTAPAILDTGKMDVVMAACNFTMSREVEDAASSLRQAGIGLVLMKALAGGGKNPRWPGQDSLPRAFARAAIAGPALRWAARREVFASMVVGMISHDEVEENLAALGSEFGDSDRKELTARMREIGPAVCRMCGRCDARCPAGLPVSSMVRCAMYADMYGQFSEARMRFRELPDEARTVRCGDCSQCPVRCPNGVRVRDRVMLAQQWLA